MWRNALRDVCVAAAVVVSLLLLGTRGQLDFEEPEYTPHLVDRIPPPAPKVYPSSKVAEIFVMYEVDTIDWDVMKVRITQKLANTIFVGVDYLEIFHVEPLIFGAGCRAELLDCALAPGQTMRDADPRKCRGKVPPIDPLLSSPPLPVWIPNWESDAELEYLAWDTFMCVSEQNTSLLKFPFIMYNTFITGYRDINNERIYSNMAKGIIWKLHVVGKIPIQWARFLNAKFQLNGSIPYPFFQPEMLDSAATVTDDLNISIGVFGVRQNNLTAEGPPLGLATFLPVCPIPKLEVKGCFRIDHNFYEHPAITFYKMSYYLLWNRYVFAMSASDSPDFRGEFNASRSPWPTFEWFGPTAQISPGPWQQYHFPQKEWSFQEGCKYGSACDPIPLVPSPRYLHSAVLYKTWNFEQHARPFLCNERPNCQQDCLVNLTCLGGQAYWQENFYWRSEQFRYDDGGVEAPLPLTSMDCPRSCCRDRRICMRVNDVLGYEVPFDSTYMLIFGGKTFVHTKDSTGKLVYHGCEQISKAEMDKHPEWRSCEEVITNEMWRYDIARGKWEFMKFDSATSPTTGLPVGYPLSRYGHAATTVITVDEASGLQRVWLYMYGGLSPQCAGGVCNDMWRYEIPWAAQAYYPKFPDGEWERANLWYRLKDGFFGGRYRHDMVTTSGQEYIYIFGGQSIGQYHDNLIRYRISTDMWEDLRPFGRQSLTRFMYDYRGLPQIVKDVPIQKYDAKVDKDCRIRWDVPYCKECPTCRLYLGRRGSGHAALPKERVDFGMTFFQDVDKDAADDSLLIVSGFRTTWGNEDSLVRSGLMSVGDDASENTYYFRDVWKYEASINQFMEIPTDGETPAARRGHRIVALRSRTNDTQIVLYGGHQQDTAYADLWILDVNRPKEERVWARIDPFIFGPRPPATSHMTMLYSQDMDLIIMFGGLSWNLTDLDVTDLRRNVDRRCYKMAQDLFETYQGAQAEVPWDEDYFLLQMKKRCTESSFCCQLSKIDPGVTESLGSVDIRYPNGTMDLLAVGRFCREDCQNRSFVPDFYPIMSPGLWTFSPQKCPNNCSGRGVCELSQCICELGWHGTDCSIQRCPGSMCYTHPRTKLQTCIECSQRGRCINGRCLCYPGWGFEDCSAVLCEKNCSSTLEVTRGICVEDFPVHQCVCTDNWSGRLCDVQLCLNNCSGRGDCVDGQCTCHQNFHGEDCSLFTFRITQDLTLPYDGVRALGF